MFVHIWAFLSRGRVVWIKEYDYVGGETVKSVAYTDTWGNMYCYRFWFTGVGCKILYPDGTANSYIEKWKYA